MTCSVLAENSSNNPELEPEHGLSLTVATGCAHQGLVNVLEQVQLFFPLNQIRTMIGGFHLAHANESEISRIAETLKSLKIGAIHPCHCTGDRAIAQLSAALPGIVHPCQTGSRIQLP